MSGSNWTKSGKPPETKRPGKKARKAARRARRLAEIKAGLRPPPKPKAKPPKSQGRKFYATVEWKRLRYDMLVKHGARCQCCGVSAQEGARLNVDHIEPISKAWHRRLDPTNLQILCGSCNAGKGGRDQTDWRPESQPIPVRWRPLTDDDIHRGNPFFYH